MAEGIRFKSNGEIVVEAGYQYVKGKLDIWWNDNANDWGIALNSLSFSDANGTVSWQRGGSESGSTDRSFKLLGDPNSNTIYSVSYTSKDCPLRLNKESDSKLSFYDDDGTDNNATVTLSTTEPKKFDSTTTPPTDGGTPPPPPPVTVDCSPGPWSESVPPTCGSPPPGVSTPGGLQITAAGSEITLNLKNYANKLVTLKVTHQVGEGTAWTQGFSFNIPNCSDISPDPGGLPYSKQPYSNPNISGTNIIYIYNVDGGDYDYKFTCSSVPGPAPWRQLYTQKCDPSCDENGENCSTYCYCVEAGIETFSPWPYCTVGVAISKNGGNKVQWQYEDGGGGDYNDQYITVEVVEVRNTVESTGPICSSVIRSNVWVPDTADSSADGKCISDYKDHSEKVRFRIPSLKASKLSITPPVCYSSFRGISGALRPEDDLGVVSPDYSVLHLMDENSRRTTSLVTDSDITVEVLKEDDTYISPYGESNPSSNTNLGTTDRKHYLVTFNDGTEIIGDNANNITISVGQGVTADGLNTPPVVFKQEKVAGTVNSLRVWFYINYEQNAQQTDDLVHIFDDETNTTSSSSILSDEGVTIVPQAVNDPGNEVEGYSTLSATNKKHYLVTFSDSTIVNADASNISFEINQNLTASGDTYKISLVKRERIDDKNMRVWFTSYNSSKPAGLEIDNTFVRDFSVARTKKINFSGNAFTRSWYLSTI